MIWTETGMKDLKDQKPNRLDHTGTGAGAGAGLGSVPVRAGSSGSIAHPYTEGYNWQVN